jgi:hypothetical protein
MGQRLSVVIAALSFGLLVSTISGCAANRVDLVDSGFLTLEKQATGKVYVAWSDAYEREDGFVVTGVLRRSDRVGSPIKTHVDVTVLSPDGRVVDTARSGDVYVSRRITGRGQSFKRFSVSFSSMPPRGSTVRVVSHSGPHDDAT